MSAVPVLDIDPFSDEWLRDPYAHYARLREAGPIFWMPRYEVFGMARHAEVSSTLNNWQAFPSGRGIGIDHIVDPSKHWRTPSLLLETDPPLHDKMRSIVSRAINAAALKPLRPVWRKEADLLLDRLVGGPAFDAVPEIAEAFPLKVFGDAVGLAYEGRENLIALGALAFDVVGPKTARVLAELENAEALFAWSIAATQRNALSDTGFGAVIHSAVDRGEATDEQARLLVRSLLSAGVDTTVSGIGAALNAFARHPDQWDLLRERPALIKTCLDEVLRWDSVVQIFFRTAADDIEVGGIPVPQHSKIAVFFAAANRDPARWSDPDPDRFDVSRRDPGHVGFGAGIHACVGQMVARLEVEVLVEAMLERVSKIELAGPVERRINSSIYPISRLPLVLHPK